MESPAARSASSAAMSEKTLDVVLSLLETVRSITSIATLGQQSDAGQTLAVGSASAQTDTKALEGDSRVRTAVPESESKPERAAKADTLSNLQQTIQLCAPATNEYSHHGSARFEEANGIRTFQQLLNEVKKTVEQLEGRSLAATPKKSGFVEPGSIPETPEKPDRDGDSGSPTRNEDPFVERSPESPLDVKSIPVEGVVAVDIQGAQDHLQELPLDLTTTVTSIVADQLLEYDSDDGFRSLEDLLGGDDEFEVASKRGLKNLDSIIGSAAIHKHAPGILEVGLDAGRVRSANTTYALGPVDRFRDYDRSYAGRRPRPFGMDRYEPAAEDYDAFKIHRAGAISGDNPRPDYFKYGLHYNPPSNIFRTVQIGNLPASINTPQLMSRVRGGQIISATICDTVKLTGSMSALVVFLYPEAAADFAEFSKSHSIIFDSRPAIVTLLNTNTWPLSNYSFRRITEQGQTRCLAILAFAKPGLSRKSLVQRSKDIERQIYRDRRYPAYRRSSLESMSLDDDGRLHISFSSVYAAALAFDILKSPHKYRHCTITFEKDPCSRPLDDLLAPAGPRADDVRETIPTDGDELDDLDADESTDVDAEDLSYRRAVRPRYRDADKSPSGNVDELSYSDVNNVAVPRFGGPLTQIAVTKKVSTARRDLPVGLVPQGSRRRSWADEMNGDETEEEEMGTVTPLVKVKSSTEVNLIPSLSTAGVVAKEISSASRTAVVSVPKERGLAGVAKVFTAQGATSTSPKDAEVEPSKGPIISCQCKLKPSVLELQIQADDDIVLAAARANSLEQEPKSILTPHKAVTTAPSLLRETSQFAGPKTAHCSLQNEAFASTSQESAHLVQRPPAVLSTAERAQALLQPVAASLPEGLEDTNTATNTRVKNLDEIDLDLDLEKEMDPSPTPSLTKAEAGVDIDIAETSPRLSAPLITVPLPASAQASKPMISGSGPCHANPTPTINPNVIKAPTPNLLKNFHGPGLATSKYATLIPGYEDVPMAPGPGFGPDSVAVPVPVLGAERNFAMFSTCLKGRGESSSGSDGGYGEGSGSGRGGGKRKRSEAGPGAGAVMVMGESVAEVNEMKREGEDEGDGQDGDGKAMGVRVGSPRSGRESASASTKGRKLIKYEEDGEGEEDQALEFSKHPTTAKVTAESKELSSPLFPPPPSPAPSSASSPSLPSDVAEDLAADSGSEEGC